ncbi:hypothetical protein JFK97_05810 [Chromobacterium phragmitis]|uniref:hypothetical protein n=1 Tax=Chromobacterium amazonense TaxID=1382803 RepID=UPI0021B73DF5|nr:hypothetical protein [Chromobacterium amazonense]MBM2883900.1 hypothetical protein [Chromobacterium amazonense]MDE1711817.1 hypothetical protein [Chromobacterium amazonense]
MEIVQFDPETGRIIQTGTSRPENIEIDRAHGQSIIEGIADALTEYVRNGAIAPRPASPARLDGMTLRDLPVPCRIIIDGQSYDCADAECALSFAHPGLHVVSVEAWPAQSATFEVAT